MILNPELTKILRHYFAQQPVRRAYIFGSVARGEASDNSDVDVLIELEKGATLFDHARISWQLEDLLQQKVDVVTDSGLSPHIQPFIVRDRILVYEK
jgi:predicted nucleotidyltransferase